MQSASKFTFFLPPRLKAAKLLKSGVPYGIIRQNIHSENFNRKCAILLVERAVLQSFAAMPSKPNRYEKRQIKTSGVYPNLTSPNAGRRKPSEKRCFILSHHENILENFQQGPGGIVAKRFTDTDKWKRQWFSDLTPKAKLVWFYLLDQCDHRGVWFENFKLMSQQIGSRVIQKDFEGWFGDKIQKIDEDKYFIRSFVEFQYKTLNPNNNAHKSIIELMENLGASEPLPSPSGGALRGAQDKVTDKVKVNCSKESDASQKPAHPAAAFEARFKHDFNALFAEYPKPIENKRGAKLQLAALFASRPDAYPEVLTAIRKYKKARHGWEDQFIKTWPKFFECWEYWVNPPESEFKQNQSADDIWAEVSKLQEKKAGGAL